MKELSSVTCSTLFVLIFSTGLFAQFSSSGGSSSGGSSSGGSSSGGGPNWPVSVPFPADLPAWPATTVTGGLSTLLRAECLVTWPGPNPPTIVLVYEFHEKIDQTPRSADTTFWATYRFKNRLEWQWMPWINNWEVRSGSGFIDNMYRESPVGTQFGFQGVRIGTYTHALRKHNTKFSSTLGVVSAEANVFEGSRWTSVAAQSMNASFTSSVNITPNMASQTLPPGSESISCLYTDNGIFWSASRSYTSYDGTDTAPPVAAHNSDRWPNSGGNGSLTLTPLVLPPNSPRYPLYYGLPYLNPDGGAAFYGVQAFFDPTWWQRTPF